jgi:hypothetical protein
MVYINIDNPLLFFKLSHQVFDIERSVDDCRNRARYWSGKLNGEEV